MSDIEKHDVIVSIIGPVPDWCEGEIVWCKDCRHYDRPNARCTKFGIDCYLADPQVSDLPGREYTFGDYGFCAWGVKRKEGGE